MYWVSASVSNGIKIAHCNYKGNSFESPHGCGPVVLKLKHTSEYLRVTDKIQKTAGPPPGGFELSVSSRNELYLPIELSWDSGFLLWGQSLRITDAAQVFHFEGQAR
jgi:hypothetical protein